MLDWMVALVQNQIYVGGFEGVDDEIHNEGK